MILVTRRNSNKGYLVLFIWLLSFIFYNQYIVSLTEAVNILKDYHRKVFVRQNFENEKKVVPFFISQRISILQGIIDQKRYQFNKFHRKYLNKQDFHLPYTVGAKSSEHKSKTEECFLFSTYNDAWEREIIDRLKFDALTSWLLSNGAKFSKLDLVNIECRNGYGKEQKDVFRGVRSNQDINQGEVIMQIPLKCLITVEMGKETPIGKIVSKNSIVSSIPSHIYIMLYILQDLKNKESFFKSYYDILPKDMTNMPLLWNEKDLLALRGSFLLNEIQEMKSSLEIYYKVLCQLAPQLKLIATFEEFIWAKLICISRNFVIEVNGRKTSAMIPFGDMLNHQRPQETKWTFDNDKNAFISQALIPITTGSTVSESYGKKSNHRFLLNYGFSVEKNIESDGSYPNEVPLELSLNASDELYLRKLVHWEKNKATKRIKKTRLSISNYENFELILSVARFLVSNEEDLHQIFDPCVPSCKSTLFDIHNPISIRNEISALDLLSKRITLQLDQYPTTLIEDERNLNSSDPNIQPLTNRRNAIIQVKGEKEILLYFHKLFTASLEKLECHKKSVFNFDNSLKNFSEGLSLGEAHAETVMKKYWNILSNYSQDIA